MEKVRFLFLNDAKEYGRAVEAAKICAKLHKKVILFMPNFYRHIQKRHPDVTVDIIVDVLTDPDLVFKKSKSTKEFYYHKVIDGKEFKVVIVPFEKNQRKVITAYSVFEKRPFLDPRKMYCSYERNLDLLEEDDDYAFFSNAFNDNTQVYENDYICCESNAS